MDNPVIQTDLAEILNKLDSKFDEKFNKLDSKFDEKFNKLDSKFDEKFNKLDSKFDKLSEDVNQLKVGQAQLITKVDNMEKEISEIKGSQNKQIWALIGIVFAAIIGLTGTLGKIVFFPST